MEKRILNKKSLLIFLILFFSNTLFANNYFTKSKIRGGVLHLYFDSEIERVTYFSLPQKNGLTKFVFDIYGAVLPYGKGISHHTYRGVNSFRIAQNSSKKLRVVIEAKSVGTHSYRGNLFTLPLKAGKTTSLPTLSASKSFKNGYTIVIDAGHGGKDNGASCCNVRREKKVVLSISKKLKSRLERLGYKVYMTRYKDTFVRLPKRTEFANKKKADIFISIHANAAPSKKRAPYFRGIEVYYLSPAQTKRAKAAAEKENSVMLKGKDYYTTNAYISLISREKIVESHKLGLDVQHRMLRNARKHYPKVGNGGVKRANFWVLVGAQMPAILVETGYITHKTEGKHLINSNYQKLLAKGIAEGIERYLKNKR